VTDGLRWIGHQNSAALAISQNGQAQAAATASTTKRARTGPGQVSPGPLNSREPGRADQPGLAAEFGRDDAQPGKEVEPGVSGQLRA
jgi:hypothetical protein